MLDIRLTNIFKNMHQDCFWVFGCYSSESPRRSNLVHHGVCLFQKSANNSSREPELVTTL